MEKDDSVSRRRFLTFVIGALGGLIAIIIGVPAFVSAILTPMINSRKKVEERWFELGKVTDFKPGPPALIRWTEDSKDGWVTTTAYRSAWVYTADGQNFTVWNPKCTHLGCLTYYDSQTNTLDSPCHAGIFGLPDGRVVSGPPPRSLDTMPVRVQDGNLYCVYKDFLLGIANKIEL